MGLLLYTRMYDAEGLNFLPCFPRKYPFTQSVNRVIPGLNPFNYTSVCESYQEINLLPWNKYSYEEMSIGRAMSFKQLNGNIYIMYSGGIDSTTALIAFILSWSNEELKRVYILASKKSVMEFPELWNIISEKFHGRIISSYAHVENFCKNGYVITGEHGDQIFGSDIIKPVVSMFGDEGINLPWKDNMEKVYSHMFGEDFAVKEFIKIHESTIEFCPFPIRTCFDWVWWYNFVNKWQHVKYRLLAYSPWEDQKNNFPNIHHFFDTPEWQSWSLDNHDIKILNTLDTYKYAAKEFIVKHTGFTDYQKKKKVGSLSSLWTNKGFYDAIDTNFNYISKNQALEYINVKI